MSKITGLILENTFTSLPSLIPHALPLLSPFAFLCHQKWHSISKVPKIPPETPILMLSGLKDEIVPKEQMRMLFEAFAKRGEATTSGGKEYRTGIERVKYLEFPQGGHSAPILYCRRFRSHSCMVICRWYMCPRWILDGHCAVHSQPLFNIRILTIDTALIHNTTWASCDIFMFLLWPLYCLHLITVSLSMCGCRGLHTCLDGLHPPRLLACYLYALRRRLPKIWQKSDKEIKIKLIVFSFKKHSNLVTYSKTGT